ncbi:uncharacterized protein KZ484_019309 isoform 1-T2 [Pholidichthys leucotaenia]
MEEQQELEPPRVKEEHEELFISQEGEQPVVKLEADTFMVTLISEENEQSEVEPNSELVFSHNSAVTEIQDEEGSQHVVSGSFNKEPKPKKRRLKTRSHSNSDDDSLTSKTLCENETDAPELHDCKEEEVLTVQHPWNQERNSSLCQEDQDAVQVKEEEEELYTSQEEEHFGLKQETDTFMVPSTEEDNNESRKEPNSEQLLSHTSPDTESQDQGAEAPQLHGWKEDVVCTVQQLWNQRWNLILDQEEQDAAQVKEAELSTSQEEGYFGLKQETDTFMVTPTDEDNDNNEKEPNSDQLLSPTSPDTEIQDQGAGKNVNPGSSKPEEPKPKKRLHRNKSDSNNVDNSLLSENQCDDTDTGEKFVKCSDDKVIRNESQRKKHHTAEGQHVCTWCGKKFKFKLNFSIHERIHTCEKSFSFESCGQTFHSSGLKTHMTIHTGEKPFSCETCGQAFIQRSHLKKHMRIHTGKKPLSCEICGQSFTQHWSLKTHMRIHTGEKPFSCETCGQRFNVGGNLKTHMRIHTGEKPFTCETCGLRFNVVGNLKTHMRIHTGEKPFSCETCGQSFNECGTLKNHMRIHTGEKPFSCETCGQSFTQRGNLKAHMRIHTGEKPFSCETCGQSFTQYGNLKTHMKIHTGEKT